MLNKRTGPMNQEEVDDQRELLKQLRERIKQLRMYDGNIDDDPPVDPFLGDGI